jgi:hypothetical protein
MSEQDQRTPSETVMGAMEAFGECEPKRVILIWVDEGGDLCWSRSAPMGHSEIVGMLECVKAVVLDGFRSEENRD